MAGIVNILEQNICFSFALQTFYRKSFNAKNVPQFFGFLTCGIFSSHFGETPFYGSVSFFATILCVWIWKRNLKFCNAVFCIIFLLEYRKQLPWTWLEFINSPERAIVCQLVVSLTQFIRKPLSLKNKMREIRVFMGPWYVLYSIRSFILVHHAFGSTYPRIADLMLVNAAVACVGGILFRPDNGFLLSKLFGWQTDLQYRRLRHRNCMVLSSGTAFISLLYIKFYVTYT